VIFNNFCADRNRKKYFFQSFLAMDPNKFESHASDMSRLMNGTLPHTQV
jgi:hypothetical protein